MAFNQIRQGRISDNIISQIKNAVFSGIFKPGDKLPSEHEMKKLFNVSRVPLREALRSLEESGLIIVKTGVSGGAFVAHMSIKPISDAFSNMIKLGKISLSDIWEFRMLFEPNMSSLAADRRNDSELLQMEEMILAREKALKVRKTPIVATLDFHVIIAKATRNPFCTLLFDTISNVYLENLRQFNFSFKDWQTIIKFHRAIFECIKKKDTIKVMEVMYDHLKDTRRRLGI